MALVREFPLRPIRSEQEHEAALAMLDSMVRRQRETRLTLEEHDYVAALRKLIEEFEESRRPHSPVTGAAKLAQLIEARGISQAEVAAGIGMSAATVSQLVRGSRPLGPNHIQRLASYFNVDPDLLRGG